MDPNPINPISHLASSSSSTKIERRIVEKNRRNQMKILYSKLTSLLPNFNSKEMMGLPDQIDEAIKYIKSLEAKVKMGEEKRDGLVGKKRSNNNYCGSSSSAGCNYFGSYGNETLKSPQIEIHEMGSSLQVVLISGLDNQFIFYEIIRILHEENVEIVSANSSLAADHSMHHIVHAKIEAGLFEFGATKVSERLKKFVVTMKLRLAYYDFSWRFTSIGDPCELAIMLAPRDNLKKHLSIAEYINFCSDSFARKPFWCEIASGPSEGVLNPPSPSFCVKFFVALCKSRYLNCISVWLTASDEPPNTFFLINLRRIPMAARRTSTATTTTTTTMKVALFSPLSLALDVVSRT
ncbi:transcription factor bHLH162-like [Senna tora]|uniref:Transcription factor bHLH162-like n=1 Tax=Senna tora TaxID=362788 RepID=A0A834WJA4_9FABA|nr:transcription factor bHLH162-like [Senna tora]